MSSIARLSTRDAEFEGKLDSLLAFDATQDVAIEGAVEKIIADVKARGDEAVLEYTRLFDQWNARSMDELRLAPQEPARALARLSSAQRGALETAAERIRAYHRKQVLSSWHYTEPDGTMLGQKITPLDRVGVYVPGGKAAYPSTVLMNVLPARVAGVGSVVMVVPTPRGERNDLVLAAASIAGVDQIFTIGGAQAVAALAYGTRTISQTDKVVGPGNAYVSEAKRYAASLPGGPQIDTPAGPSELMVVADDSARADFVAADLLSQAEHDGDAQVLLVAASPSLATRVQEELAHQLKTLPRAEIATRSLENARCILVEDADTAIDIANLYAPEHLSLQIAGAEALAESVRNAGAVFIGPWSAETFGDYVCGPSHVLPTDGAARAWSGVNVASFMKCVNVQTLTQTGAHELARAAARLARLEGLEAHARAADLRGAH